ncbi:MAG: hypothetical protein HN341_07565 [Verrucomicrobia bacterium]|nr:hypothetical protein [Verrucomicrobiota bacterium]
MKKMLCALGVSLLIGAAHASVLIDHDFSDGDGTTLNGETVDGGTLQTGGLTWVSPNDTTMTKNGAINTPNVQSAHIDISSVINPADQGKFELEIVVDNTMGGARTRMITVGFWSGTPSTGVSHDTTTSAAWWMWRGNADFQILGGLGYTVGERIISSLSTAGGFETLTTVLDFTSYDGTSDYGTMEVFKGANSFGTITFTGDESFNAVGIGAMYGRAADPVTGTIQSFKLSGITPPAATITHVATDETGDAGAFTGPEWRTASVAKPHDGDSDNILGTDGWKWFGYSVSGAVANNGTHDVYSTTDADDDTLPSYITSISSTPKAWEGSNGWADFDDPLNVGSDKRGTYGYGESDFDIIIERATNEKFRLTLFGSAAGAGIANTITVSNAILGGGDASGYNVSGGERWYMYFDIGEGSDDIKVSIDRVSGDNRGLTGMAFDAQPLKGTVISIQ